MTYEQVHLFGLCTSIVVVESQFASQQSQPGEWGRGNRISSFPSSASKLLAQQSLLIGFKSKLRLCQAAIRCKYIFIFSCLKSP